MCCFVNDVPYCVYLLHAPCCSVYLGPQKKHKRPNQHLHQSRHVFEAYIRVRDIAKGWSVAL